MRRALLLTGLCTGCLAAPEAVNLAPEAVSPTAPAPVQMAARVEAPAVELGCEVQKFWFTQDLGCVNDGWVEFCAQKAGAPVVSRLRAIAPGLIIEEQQIGPAGCDEALDYRVKYQLDPAAECTGYHGGLTAEAWGRLCQLAAVPQTRHFVPGWAQ